MSKVWNDDERTFGVLSTTTIEGDWRTGKFTVTEDAVADFTRVLDSVQPKPHKEPSEIVESDIQTKSQNEG